MDVKNATYTNSIGDVELKKVWKDPDFDPSLHAFYYARVCRSRRRAGPPTTPRSWAFRRRLSAATVQERAWTSPIWFIPTKMPQKKPLLGRWCRCFKEQGATAWTMRLEGADRRENAQDSKQCHQSELKSFTGDDGRRLITKMDGKQAEVGEMWDVWGGGQRCRRLMRSRMERS